jgi:hypothetical protein
MMLSDGQSREGHEKFMELAALAGSGTLTPQEWSQLKAHLEICQECREVSLQYRVLATRGIAVLATAYTEWQDHGNWDDTATREKLLTRVRADQQPVLQRTERPPVTAPPHLLRRIAVNPFAQAALAASLVLAIGFGAYRLGTHSRTEVASDSASVEDRLQKLAAEKKSEEALLAVQAKELAQLQGESSQKEQELAKLRSELRALEEHSNQLVAANNQSEGQLRAIAQQRDTLNTQVQEASQTYQNIRAELLSLSAERDKALARSTSLEAKLNELTAINQDQERRLKDAEQYLASDRDIRELMGARKLYIADVFDVDSGSRTRKPYGRVFYTQGKSLIFYAFDLEREPGFVNASTFQVWGQKETAQGEAALPLNLGILYMDNESNRRWVMRFDDPKRLAAIDAVFVTVEPHGGSQKPTSKPFLYALLRNEVNHP